MSWFLFYQTIKNPAAAGFLGRGRKTLQTDTVKTALTAIRGTTNGIGRLIAL